MTLLQREWNQLRASNQAEIALKMEHANGTMSKNRRVQWTGRLCETLCLPVQGIVNTVTINSLEAKPVGLKASSSGSFLVIVHIEDSVEEPWWAAREIRSCVVFTSTHSICRLQRSTVWRQMENGSRIRTSCFAATGMVPATELAWMCRGANSKVHCYSIYQ